MVISENQEVLLSYLCGLAQIGQPFHIERRHIVKDLEYTEPTSFNFFLRRLIDVGAVVLVSRGFAKCAAQMIVLKRPEEFTIVATKPFQKPTEAGQQLKIARAAKPKKRRLIPFAGYDDTERPRA